MAINTINGKAGVTLPSTPTIKKEKAGNSQSITTEGAKDSVDITAITQKIKNAFESSTPVINEEKIAAVKNALKEGNYQIDAESIANKILQIDRHFDST